MEEGYFKGLFSGISSPTGTAVLGSVDLYLGQCIREGLRGGWVNSGTSVHSVGRANVDFPTLPSWRNGATSVCIPLTTPPSLPLTQPASCLFSCSCIWPRGLTDWQQKKNFISYTNNSSMLLNHYLPKRKKNMLLCHIKKFLQHFIESEGKYSSGLQSL